MVIAFIFTVEIKIEENDGLYRLKGTIR